MVVKAERKHAQPNYSDEEGQSLIEFLLLLPLMVGFTSVLLHVNTAIQSSIVNQQYARAQTLALTANNSVYPRIDHLRVTSFDKKGYNKMVLGISEESTDPDDEAEKNPSAPVVNILRKPGANQGSDESGQDGPPERSNIRIRTTVTLCTQVNVSGGKPLLPIAENASGRGGSATGPSNLSDNTQFDYCVGEPG